MDGDVSGVRIVPPSLEFLDTEVGNVYELNITVKNISKISRNIRYYGPKTKNFTLKAKNPDSPVAPGLSVSAVVQFESTEAVLETDRLVVTVDGDVIEIPLKGYPQQPILSVDKDVNFGNAVATSKVISREIKLTNTGSKAGEFKIKYTGDKPIAVIPNTGVVPAKSVQIIKVEYVTKEPACFDEEVKVKLEGQDEATSFRVRGNVVKRMLEVLSLQTEKKIDCVRFGSTYYGTDKTECCVLYNNGPEEISFVSVLDEDAIAQELGVDLTRSTVKALADQDVNAEKPQGEANPLTSLVTAIPNQGVLRPYEKIPIFFRFSPRWNQAKQGWKSHISPPPRKDFALFMRIQIIGSNEGFLNENSKDKKVTTSSHVEMALTGTALPVLLSIAPAAKFDFEECPVGEHADVLCTIKNENDLLPASFQFRRIAHFTAYPAMGKILPEQTQDIIISFSPHQAGSFKIQQLVDVIGYVSDSFNPAQAQLEPIYTLPIQLIGKSDPITIKKSPRYNPGITPHISHEVGMYVDTTFTSLNGEKPRNAISGGHKTQLHTLRTTKSCENLMTKVAFPNDRSRSIRPSDRKDTFKTIFTKNQRHTYVDPDYAYTDEEEAQRSTHRSGYKEKLIEMRENRINRRKSREFKQTNNKVDIGIKSASGLVPKKLSLDEIIPDPLAPHPPNSEWRVLSSKELARSERVATSKPVRDGLNAVPTTAVEKADCSKRLSPQQLYQVVIGPATIDFGKVCLRSVNTRELNIVNNLEQHVLVVAEIDCRELRQSSPLSQVVPPHSKATLPILFESGVKGRFQRSVSYTVNSYYKDHVTVLAEVVPVSLELSTEELVIKPTYNLPAEAGFRSYVTLHNRLNYPAEFTWAPNLDEKGTAFSIRPATGTVEANRDLDCEVVWHPSYMAPDDGSFSLMIQGGNTMLFKCRVELGSTNVQFVDRRIMFGQVPIHLTTTRTALLNNLGQNHAYFQVLDPSPFPGLTVTPLHGVVPVGGTAEIQVSLTPDSLLKFDTKVQVAIRGWKTIELRMGGTVEPPKVDIDIDSFNFGGVHCGSGSSLPFRLVNQTVTKAKLEFDLTRYRDFTLNFSGFQTQDDYNYQMLNPGMYTVTLGSEEIVEGEILFMPTEVAAYDFVMPVMINQTGAPTPAPTPYPPTPAPSQKNSLQHIINPRPVPYVIPTPRKHVIATGLRQPLQLSVNRLEFHLPSGFAEDFKNSGLINGKSTTLINNTNKPLKWGLDLSKPFKALEDGIIKFVHPNGAPFVTMDKENSKGIEGTLEPGKTQQIAVVFCPTEAGKYEILIPVIINDEWEKPYQFLHITGDLKSPKLWFDPTAIVLTPVPLSTEVTQEFTILAAQYREITELQVEVPEVECDDGSKISPLKVTFQEGNEVRPCCGDEGQIEPCGVSCKVTFCSTKPISFSSPLIFTDPSGRSFSLTVTATADNCILSCYPFLAQHRSDHQIVCEQGLIPKGRKADIQENLSGEAVFVPCESPHHNSRPSTSATSSTFQISSSSYESSASVADSADDSTPGPRDGAVNKPHTSSERSRNNQDIASRSLGSALFPDEDSEEGIFHMEVLLAVQRFFSAQGWPGGPFPIIVPESLRTGLSRKPSGDQGKSSGGFDANNVKKEFKTIYDMISNLSGRPVPGIPINSPLPADPIEKVKQVYWQHTTLLTFMKCQGASIAAVKPEYLMEPRDYMMWKQLQSQLKIELIRQGREEDAMKIKEEEELDVDVFEALSKRAWTDILLQIFKCLVLAKVTPRTLKNITSPDKNIEMPSVNPDPLTSNVYSIGERIVLSWLNHYYEHFRKNIWKDCTKGGVPPSRWIVNYDFDLLDGLVLGAVLGAHMPFLIKSHLQDMYTHPCTAEQCLHNALKVVHAMQFAGIDYDIQAIDITDPNPIALLMLSLHLYQRLPHYIPKSDIDFSGGLHSTVTRQIKLSNPSGKSLQYQVLLAGRDARDFKITKGEHVTVPPKSVLPLSIEFTSRFLRPAEATIILIGRRQGSSMGTTLSFNLRTQVDNITPRKPAKDAKNTIKVESPCYNLERISLDITNPFTEGGNFKIVLVEAKGGLLSANQASSLVKPKEKKKKKVKAKIDHGQNRPETPPSPTIVDAFSFTKKEDESANMSAFFSPLTSIHLGPKESTSVEVHYLPFNTGERQCSVIFLNEAIGEFLYSIEAKSTSPLPSVLPFVPSPHSVRISSAAAAGRGRGMFGGDDRVIYWKCESGQKLDESLIIPITNLAKEQALQIAAQQEDTDSDDKESFISVTSPEVHMSDVEMQRRIVTGTLNTSSVTSKIISTLSNDPTSAIKQAKAKKPTGSTFTVEIDSDHFDAPKKLVMPTANEAKVQTTPYGVKAPSGINLEDGFVELPIKFKPSDPGHYPCTITLSSKDDVRVYKIECTVNPEGSNAEIEFKSPVHETVTQEIPIVNMTNHDWPLIASFQGSGFIGTPSLLVKAGQTTNYPLVFKPECEKSYNCTLVLTNKEDGTEHIFHLLGHGEKPLAIENIFLKCQARSSTNHVLMIPNVTKKKLCYKVESDLPFISGNATVNVLPGKVAKYSLSATPTRRGTFKGMIAFVAGENPVIEVDSDGDEVQDEADRDYQGYRVWYSIEVKASPQPPERSLEITCTCQKKAFLEVIVRNPTPEDITLDVSTEGKHLSGEPTISLPAGSRDVYVVTYSPSAIGRRKGSIIFYHELVGEFWYELILNAESPATTTLPHMECELGRWVEQIIVLNNPTEERLELTPTVSNSNNFTIEQDNQRPLVLPPLSQIEVPLHFMPSALGYADHMADIIFRSEQLGEWKFVASGTGLLPQPQDPVSVYAVKGSNTTLIIPFRNPTDKAVLVEVLLKDTVLEDERMTMGYETFNTPFCLLLKDGVGMRVGPKTNLDIPICFAPTEMRKYEALCTVVVRPEDQQDWTVSPTNKRRNNPTSVSAPSSVSEIRWQYPITGIPEASPLRESQAAVVECRARERIEERLEVVLSGVAASASASQKGIKARSLTPKGENPRVPDGIVVTDGLVIADEFTFDIDVEDGVSRENLENCVVLKLIRQQRDNHTGLMVLVFNIIFAPYQSMSYDVKLVVTAATGGLWRFPLKFVATEPPVDDKILIEATGLNKESTIGFRLNSQTNHPVLYNAFFTSGSDPEFTVSPQSGELAAKGTPGTLIHVSFAPTVYGKLHEAKLIVQSPDMMWSYYVKGVLPDYDPPRGHSSKPMAGPHPDPRKRKENVNYLRENMRLLATAVSSPIKGGKLISRPNLVSY